MDVGGLGLTWVDLVGRGWTLEDIEKVFLWWVDVGGRGWTWVDVAVVC